MKKDEYIKELYEKYEDEFERTKEYQVLAEKLDKIYNKIQKNYTAEQVKNIDEFEQCLTKLLEIEVKEALKNGFKAGEELTKKKKIKE